MPSNSSSQKLSIAVYKGDPLDFTKTRHTALFIEYPDGTSLLTHIRGASGFFDHEERWDASHPTQSKTFECLIPVATIQTPTARDMNLRDKIYATPINNSDVSWNCQNWVGDALWKLEGSKLISAEIARKAIDDMVAVVIEAKDEEA